MSKKGRYRTKLIPLALRFRFSADVSSLVSVRKSLAIPLDLDRFQAVKNPDRIGSFKPPPLFPPSRFLYHKA
jgi:hypothetical protein